MSDPNSDSDEGLYDFAPEIQMPMKQVPRPRPAGGDGPVVLSYRRPMDDKPEPAEPQAIKDWYLPLVLLGGGAVVDLLAALIWEHSHLSRALLAVAVQLTLGTAVMLVAMLIAARLRHIDLGDIRIATLKLAAISVAPAAASQFVMPVLSIIPFGGIAVWIGQFMLFFALLGALFDLDENDTWYCVCTMFVTQLVVYFTSALVF